MARSAAVGVSMGLAATLLAGCAQLKVFSPLGMAASPQRQGQGCEADGDPDQNVKLDLIRQLMDGGKLYAALAHLDATRSNSPQVIYLRAEIFRRTDRTDQAGPLYRELVAGCMAGRGYHGLGLIAGRENRIAEAIDHLEKARIELPIDTRVRNDLGYALLLDGRFDAARNEFLTALELDGGDSLAATNMLLLLSVAEREHELRAFADHMNIGTETVARLRSQAEEIRASIAQRSE